MFTGTSDPSDPSLIHVTGEDGARYRVRLSGTAPHEVLWVDKVYIRRSPIGGELEVRRRLYDAGTEQPALIQHLGRAALEAKARGR